MKDEEINVAIAEACGWRCCKRDIDIANAVYTRPYHSLVGIEPRLEYDGSKDWHYWIIPNYAGDLNAMHEAEGCLNERQCDDYELWLKDFNAAGGKPCKLYRWHATARQRAEAFLRTIGKWKEEA